MSRAESYIQGLDGDVSVSDCVNVPWWIRAKGHRVVLKDSEKVVPEQRDGGWRWIGPCELVTQVEGV